jgi:RNA-directed DNA polymerase
MHIIKIKKSSGKWRTIYVPSKQEKIRSNVARENSQFVLRLLTSENHHVLHGFTKDRSPVTNAMAHKHRKFTLTFDLAEFFDSVTPEHLARSLKADEDSIGETWKEAVFYDGAARQGLPSSPDVCNLAATPVDNDIMALNKHSRFGWLFVYTRYADDLTFSADSMGVIEMLKKEVPKIIKKHKFVLNEEKTHLQCQVAGRRIITGISVGESEIRITREMKRRIRAGLHQLKNGFRGRFLSKLVSRQKERRRSSQDKGPPLRLIAEQIMDGQLEWAQLKLPKNAPPEPEQPKPRPLKKLVTGAIIPSAGSISYKPLARKFAK